MNAGRLDVTQPMRNQDQGKQRNRKADAHGQGFNGTIALAFVAHQVKKGGAEAADDQYKSDGNNDFHGACEAMGYRASFRFEVGVKVL